MIKQRFFNRPHHFEPSNWLVNHLPNRYPQVPVQNQGGPEGPPVQFSQVVSASESVLAKANPLRIASASRETTSRSRAFGADFKRSREASALSARNLLFAAVRRTFGQSGTTAKFTRRLDFWNAMMTTGTSQSCSRKGIGTVLNVTCTHNEA